MRVPQPEAEEDEDEVVIAAEIDDDPIPTAKFITTEPIGVPTATAAPTPPQIPDNKPPTVRNPAPYSPTAQKLLAEHRKNEAGQPYKAGNPGLLKPSMAKFLATFPHRFAWRFGLLLFLIGLCFLHWIFIPVALFMAYRVWKYLSEIRSNFVSGLICPAKILSVDPPIVATYVDQSIGIASCHVVRLMEQPLHKLPPNLATPRRCASICYFYGMYPGLSKHWFQPLPTLPEFVSDDKVELQRIQNSIPDDSWNMLEMGLKQLPANPELRTYRIIQPGFRPQLAFRTKGELALIANPLMNEAGAKIGGDITAESLGDANKASGSPLDLNNVIAVDNSVVVMTQGIFFHSRGTGTFVFWKDIKVAFVNFDQLEIVRIDGERSLFKIDGIRMAVQLEKLINRAISVGKND